MSSSSSSVSSDSQPTTLKKKPTADKHGQEGPLADKAAALALALERAPIVPKALVPYIDGASHVVVFLIASVEASLPIFHYLYLRALALWAVLAPYNPELLLPSLAGFVMCFFGGSFLTVIAAVEAYRMIGYQDTLDAIKELVNDVQQVRAADKKDDEEDLDGDGIPDVQEVSKEKLAARKTLLFLRTVDPIRVQAAVFAINAGLLAVLATLKLQFAKSITLGHAIAHSISVPAEKFLLPHIENCVHADYRKWVQPIMSYIINAFSISIAWFIQRVISAFHSAVRGGFLFTRNLLKYLSVKGYLVIDHETTIIDEVGGFVLAALGLYFQLSQAFSLPFPLNILLAPVSAVEYSLIWAANQ